MHEVRRIVDDLAVQPARQRRVDDGEDLVHPRDYVEQIGRWRHLDADIDRGLAVKGDLRLVAVRAERDLGHVLQPHDCPTRLFHDEIGEFALRYAGRSMRSG